MASRAGITTTQLKFKNANDLIKDTHDFNYTINIKTEIWVVFFKYFILISHHFFFFFLGKLKTLVSVFSSYSRLLARYLEHSAHLDNHCMYGWINIWIKNKSTNEVLLFFLATVWANIAPSNRTPVDFPTTFHFRGHLRILVAA